MTNDELLAKLYDGTLTEGERTALDQRIQDSPEFAGEVEEFETVVELMNTPSEDDEPKPALLSSTKERVIALIGAAAGTATIGGAASQMGGGLFSSAIVQWATGIVGALTIGGVAYWAVTDEEPQNPAAEQTVVEQVQPLDTDNNTADNPNAAAADTDELQEPATADQDLPTADHPGTVLPAETNGDEDVPPVVEQVNTSGDPVAEPETESSAETFADAMASLADPKLAALRLANDGDQQSLLRMQAADNSVRQAHFLARIADRLARLKEFDESYDKANQAIELLQNAESDANLAHAWYGRGAASIGLGNMAEAVEALDKSETLAVNNNLTELQGKINGQRGLMALAEGDVNLALERVTKCVMMLKNAGSKEIEVGVWEEWHKTIKDMAN